MKKSLRYPSTFLTGSCFLLLLLAFPSCAPRVAPYEHGSVMKQKHIHETFQPILEFMSVQPGVVFADVGAASGDITVMMATLMDGVTIYIQDIDTSTLQQNNLDKIINYYSAQSHQDLRKKNKFHLTIGDPLHTGLPESTFDLMYTNATLHVFDAPDSVLTDMRKKLKPTGKLFIRDSFKNDHGAGTHCSDPECAKPLLSIEEFLTLMKKNGFVLVKQAPEMSGYPLFGFALAN
jgi:ubiquinone/menaquinone biosynthesis C-methylase UbiE